MKTFLLLCLAILSVVLCPDDRIKVSRLTFHPGVTPADADFHNSDLEAAWANDECHTLELRMATCPEPHELKYSSSDAMTIMGFQHVVVVAVDAAGNIIMNEKAALPCPPHCPLKLESTTLADFLARH